MENKVIGLSPLDVKAVILIYEFKSVSVTLIRSRLKLTEKETVQIICNLIEAEIISPYHHKGHKIIMSLTKFWSLKIGGERLLKLNYNEN